MVKNFCIKFKKAGIRAILLARVEPEINFNKQIYTLVLVRILCFWVIPQSTDFMILLIANTWVHGAPVKRAHTTQMKKATKKLVCERLRNNDVDFLSPRF